MMENISKSVGMLVGAGTFSFGLLIVILIIVQPSLLLKGEEWTLIEVLDNDDGLWLNEDGDFAVDSVEGYEIGETYESEAGFDGGTAFMGVVYIVVGFMIFIVHPRIY